MNLETHRVFLNAKEVFLTPKEFAILELLWKNKGNVFSTEHIYNTLWSEEEAYDTNNVVMVHIRNLRSKIESDVKIPGILRQYGVSDTNFLRLLFLFKIGII